MTFPSNSAACTIFFVTYEKLPPSPPRRAQFRKALESRRTDADARVADAYAAERAPTLFLSSFLPVTQVTQHVLCVCVAAEGRNSGREKKREGETSRSVVLLSRGGGSLLDTGSAREKTQLYLTS